MEDLVSVIVPVFNKEKYLEECVKSILNQDYTAIEIILIDDVSEDGSFNLMKRLQKLDHRISIYQMEKNSGPGAVRNFGIRKSSGKYIQFVDADDVIDKTMTTELIKKYDNNVDLVICGYAIFNERANHTKYISEEDRIISFEEYKKIILKWTTDVLVGSPDNKLFKRDLIVSNNVFFPENQNWAEDFCFNMEYVNNCKRIAMISNNLYWVRRGIDSLTVNNIKCMNIKKAYQERIRVIKILEKFRWEDSDQKNFIPQRILIRLVRLAALHNCAFEELKSLMNVIASGMESRDYFRGKSSSFLNKKEKIFFYLLNKRLFTVLAIYEMKRAMIAPHLKKILKVE